MKTTGTALAAALPVLQKLESCGFETVFVGGCVRDSLWKRPLKDIDIATAARPEQVMDLFPQTIPTGLKHGTVTVIHNDSHYEVTTFRTESGYEDFRRPASVQFVDNLAADLQRRDFTINAMAMRSNGEIFDPVGGLDDIRKGVLRCVGDPDARFQEDALRMLRAIRFAAEYELRIAPATWRAIKRHQRLLVNIAMERIGSECDKMIGGSHPDRAIVWFAASGLMDDTKEPLPERIQAWGGRRESLGSLANITLLDEPDDRWAACCLAGDLPLPAVKGLFQALCFSARRASRLTAIIALHEAMVEAIKNLSFRSENEWLSLLQDWKLRVLEHGEYASRAWLRIIGELPGLLPSAAERHSIPPLDRTTGSSVEADYSDSLINRLKRELDSLPAFSLSGLAADGSAVLARVGKPAGPWLGRLLEKLLRATALGEVANEKEQLLNYAEQVNRDEVIND
ncbi:CCA tRNA nucleotidyltransferase [Paenibacillus nasutitermitis]|uniref:CCA tRNA nucleotidyltransferase n=1 Tax=Paenibacillus nasutitermitis TaxID=1652958 RepID=A0A917DUV1_9BACL|nr:CCA tRNA nucleotidyltransferase [Paenibacillus nasutitermitis]GGD68974.1 hypothetical protein GCM10010911_28460 [Paenibacillus nasutitermitis]